MFSFLKTGDVISGSNGRQITKYRICIGNQMISTNKIVQARRARAICVFEKIYECSFIPNCTREII